MAKLSKDAFAVMAICGKSREHFGITVDPRQGKYIFCWGFKIKEGQARREGYDTKSVHGSIDFDDDYNGCPYCGARNFYICGTCGKIVCYKGESFVTCPNCGIGSTVFAAETFDISGGGF